MTKLTGGLMSVFSCRFQRTELGGTLKTRSIVQFSTFYSYHNPIIHFLELIPKSFTQQVWHLASRISNVNQRKNYNECVRCTCHIR